MAEAANKKVLVIDMNEDKARKSEASGLQKLCQDIRNSNVTKYISRTIMAVHDPDCSSICVVPHNNTRNYAMIEIFSPSGESLELPIKYVNAFLTSHKYKVIGSKNFKNKEYPVCKLIVKFQ